jgi:hypothetical protein
MPGPSIHNEMSDAPRDREIEAWNGFFGWYKTRYEDGEWPLHGDGTKGRWVGGVWYPVPSRWRELTTVSGDGSRPVVMV